MSAQKQAELLEHFVAGTTARCTADLVSANTKTAAYYFYRLRQIISHELGEKSVQYLVGEIEVDESYFGGIHKDKLLRKAPVPGLLKQGGKVYTAIIPNTKSKTLMPIIRAKVQPDSIVYSDCWRAYNALDVSEFKHYRINHSKLFAESKNQINRIEDF